MIDPDVPENAPPDQSGEKPADRDVHGRLLPGHSVGAETRWGTPGNPPPRSPGRPRKDAWIRELELRLEDPRLRQALADVLIKTALKGGDRARLQALDMIQDRVGGPVTRAVVVDVDVEQRTGVLVVPASMSVEAWIQRQAARNALLVEPRREGDGAN